MVLCREKSETVLNSWSSTNAALPFYVYNIIVEKCVFFMLYNSNENIFKIYMTHTLLHLNNIFSPTFRPEVRQG